MTTQPDTSPEAVANKATMSQFRVLVCGGRYYGDWDEVQIRLGSLSEGHDNMVIINGGAGGADYLARRFAREWQIPCLTEAADWKKHGKAAGPIRNQRMIDIHKPHLVVAFPGGNGTADMIDRATRAGIEVRRIEP